MNEQLDFDDVMIKPKDSNVESRRDAIITKTYKFKWTDKVIEGNPAIAANMATTGTFEMARELQKHQMFCALHKHYTAEELIQFLNQNKKNFGTNDYIFIGTGLRKDDFDKLKQVMETRLCNNICLDAPNGYIRGFVQHLNRLRTLFPKAVIMAGNIVTPEKTTELIKNGADIVKVGIGSSAVCRTRTQTGIGRPQLSAVMDCAAAAKGQGAMVCSDGGIQKPADYVKAIGANADFVMMGGYLAGYSEAAGDLISRYIRTGFVDTNGKDIIEERKYKLFYGMSSSFAQKQHYDGLPYYRASEGTVFEVPFKGNVASAIQNLEGGLRSAMTYTGARTLEEFPKSVEFYRVKTQLNRMFGYNEKE